MTETNGTEQLKLLGRLERHIDDLIGSGFFGQHVADGCRLCRAHRIHDSLLVLYRLCEEHMDGKCDQPPPAQRDKE